MNADATEPQTANRTGDEMETEVLNGVVQAARQVEPERNLPAPRPSGFLPANLSEAMQLSTTLSKSGLMPPALRGKPADILLVLMKGHELGLAPMQAIASINVVAGKAVCEAALMVGLCLSKPEVCEYFQLVESSTERATYETKRKGAPKPVQLTYTFAEAQAANLTGKDNWKYHKAAMLRARASGALARAVYPDLAMGLYTPDEADEFRGRGLGPVPAGEVHSDPEFPREIQVERTPPPQEDALGLPPEPGSHDGPEIPIFIGTIDETWEKSGTRKDRKSGKDIPWTLYNIRVMSAEGESLVFGTFDTAHLKTINDAGKNPVRIVWERTVKGNMNIVSIEAA